MVQHGFASGERAAVKGAGARNDLYLIGRICARDEQAFEELYRHYHPRLTRFLTNLIHRPPLVEEILNDTMLVVWNRPERFNGRCKLSTWIFAIAYRTAMTALRRFDDPVPDENADSYASETSAPDRDVGEKRLQQLVLQALQKLSPDHRAVVDLTYFHEMGYREIAEIMDCPVDTVKTRMFHARRHLRRHLGGEFEDWVQG